TSAVTTDLPMRSTSASGVRLSAIILTGYEAELHSQAKRARWPRGVPERRPASQLSQSGGGTWRDAIDDQPSGALARDACRRGALHTHDAQRRPDGSRPAIPIARQAGLRGAHRRKRGRARPRKTTCRTVTSHSAAGDRADPARAADRVLLRSLSRDRSRDRSKRGA